MFSFFKKKDSDDEAGSKNAPAAVRQPAPNAAGNAPSSPAEDNSLNDEHNDGLSGFEVSTGGDSQLSPAEEEATILHANGHSAEAIPILQAEVTAIRGQRKLETWLMLFELYQQQGDRAAFEALGLDFVIEFEKTPQIWRERKAIVAKPAQAPGNHCVFGSKLLSETISKELTAFRNASARIDPLRLDFGRVKEIDSMAAAELLSIWQMAKKVSAPRQILGGGSFIPLLSSLIETGRNAPAEAPFWLLLIELHQAMGQQEEFENIAIEYAITFEVSPPSWDPRLAPKPADKAAVAAAAAENENTAAVGDGLQIPSNVTTDHPERLSEIRDYAQKQGGEVLLDFDMVDRVDFESAGQFLNIFMELLQQGRTVRIVRANELVLALLRLMSVTEMVTVERRK